MKKTYIITGIIILAFIVIAFYLKENNFVVIDGEKIKVEVADNDLERQQGLMYREELCNNCGMLFVFNQEGIYSFWMKNTLIPLDMIFINSEMEVVDILHALPCEKEICESYFPKEKALYVLEVNYGMFDESIVGEKVEMKI
jgi:uncharacterized membrane protein (UPF0127 family)